MGLDLSVLPIKKGTDNAQSVLLFQRDSSLFEQIKHIEKSNGLPLEKPIFGYFGNKYSSQIRNPYLSTITRLEPSDFLDVFSNYSINNSILSFLRSLPSDYEILLYWQ